MAITVQLPQVGESVVEGTIGKWLKKPGDKIRRFESLVEIVTDKVTMEVPSPVNGQLLRILAEEGQTVPMGAPIAEIDSTEDASSGAAPPQTTPGHEAGGAYQARPAPSEQSQPAPGTIGYLVKDMKAAGPTGAGEAEEEAADIAATSPTADATWPSRPAQPPPSASKVDDEPSTATVAASVRHSPAVRRLAEEHGVDLGVVKGSGMGGRITRDNVLQYVQGRQAPGAKATVPTVEPEQALAPVRPAGPAPSPADEEYLPLTPVRRTIAEATARSAREIPHAWAMVEADVTNLVSWRNSLKSAFAKKEGVDLTYLPFVIKAVVESLKEHPRLNASWGGDKIILKKRINVGIAVASPAGLVVPVIHGADGFSIAGLARAARDLTEKTRRNRLKLQDVQGGTFTVNNTGALGTVVSQPIINYPQAAILTTEAVQKRAVVRDDAIAIRSMMNLCASFDHRINDGDQASGFLGAVKRRLETMGPDTPIY